MMKNKVIEIMAKDWNAYADAFGKKDDCAYVVVDNSNDSVEKFYKTWRGAYSYIEKTYDKFTYGLSKKGIVIINRKEVEDYIETINKEKETENNMPLYNIGDVLEDECNKKIKMIVKSVIKNNRGYSYEYVTTEKTKRNRKVRWLDQSKNYNVIYSIKRGY